MVSAGISQALDLVCTRFAKPGDTIFVEEPTYFLALDIFRDHGLTVVGIPIDGDGLRTDVLRDMLTRHRAAFLYTIPSFQNPSAANDVGGTTRGVDRTQRRIRVARGGRRGVPTARLRRRATAATGDIRGCGIACSRSGRSPRSVRQDCDWGGYTAHPRCWRRWPTRAWWRAAAGLNPFASSVMKSLIDLGLADRVLDDLRSVHAHHAGVLCEALRVHMPRATFCRAAGWLLRVVGTSARPHGYRTTEDGNETGRDLPSRFALCLWRWFPARGAVEFRALR